MNYSVHSYFNASLAIFFAVVISIMSLVVAAKPELKKNESNKIYIEYKLISEYIFTETVKVNLRIDNEEILARSKVIRRPFNEKYETAKCSYGIIKNLVGRTVTATYSLGVNFCGYVFNGLKIGDNIEYTVTVQHRKPTEIGGFSAIFFFDPKSLIEIADIAIEYPRALPLKFHATGMINGYSKSGGQDRLQFRYTRSSLQLNAESQKSTGTAKLILSTYAGFDKVAEAYRRASADKIVKSKLLREVKLETDGEGLSDIQVIRSAYKWVQFNISYKSTPLKDDGLQPEDIDNILRNRAGDCKDHVLLLQALLKLRNISSTPALVNSKFDYSLLPLPAFANFDHVVLYIPIIKKYIDATNKISDVNVLPIQLYGKPTLHVEGGGVQYIPSLDSNDGISLKSRFYFDNKGSIHAMTEAVAIGVAASDMKATSLKFNDAHDSAMLKAMLIKSGYTSPKGSLIFTEDKLTGDFTTTLEYSGDGAISVTQPTSLKIRSFINPSYSFLQVTKPGGEHSGDFPYGCYSKKISEEFDIALSNALQVVTLPKGISVYNKDSIYVSSYRRNATGIRVERKLISDFKAENCTPEQRILNKKILKLIALDLNAEIIFSPQ